MTKRKTRWTAIVLGVVLATAAIGIIFLFTADLGRFKPSIEALATRALGRELRIEGELHIRLGRKLDVQASGVRLAGTAAGSGEPALEAGEFAITLTTASLVRGPLRVDALSLDDAVIRIVARDEAGNDGNSDRSFKLPNLGSVSLTNTTIEFPLSEGTSTLALDTASLEQKDGDWFVNVAGTLNDEMLRVNSRLGPVANVGEPRPLALAAEGNLGPIDFTAKASTDEARTFLQPQLELTVSGGDAGYLLGLLNAPAITDGPLDLDVSIGRDESGQAIRLDAKGQLGQFGLEANGTVDALPNAQSGSLSFKLSGPSLGHVASILGVKKLPEAPYAAAGSLKVGTDRIQIETLHLEVAKTELDATGWVGRSAEPVTMGVVLHAKGAHIETFSALSKLPKTFTGDFEATANLQTDDSGAAPLEIEARIGATTGHATGNKIPRLGPGTLRLEAEVRGPDLSVMHPVVAKHLAEPMSFAITGGVGIEKANVVLDGLRLVLDDPQATILGSGTVVRGSKRTSMEIDASLADGRVQGRVDLVPAGAQTTAGFDLAVSDLNLPVIIPATAAFQPADLPVTGEFKGELGGNRVRFDEFHFVAADARVKAQGAIDLTGKSDLSFEFDLSVPSVAGMGSSDHVALPDLAMTAKGTLVSSSSGLIQLSDTALAVGKSTLTMTGSYQPGERPLVDISVNAPLIDITEFYDPQPESQENPAVPRDRAIPDVAFPVAYLDALDLTLSLEVADLVGYRVRYSNAKAVAVLAQGALDVTQFSLASTHGGLQGTARYAPGEQGYALTLNVTGRELRLIGPSRPNAEQLAARPAMDIDADIESVGEDLRSVLAGLDGRMLVNTGSGTVPLAYSTWLANILFGDLAFEVLDTLNPFTQRKENQQLECAVVLLAINDGIIDGKPLAVIQTDKLTLFSAGEINLKTEAIRLDIKTQVRTGIGVRVGDVVDPYMSIGGTMAKPVMQLDPSGAMESGVAIATGGLSMLAKGLHGRFLSDKDPCGTALKEFKGDEE